MKDPKSVGKDFDRYAKKWQAAKYGMEIGSNNSGVVTEQSPDVQKPGDEWGQVDPLRELYRRMFEKYLDSSKPVNILEIGAGGGRSTGCVLDVLESRISSYTVIDVSYEFTRVLHERYGHRVQIEIVDDVDLSMLESRKYDFCLAQSSWSHINMYDQYRYLRELRRVLKPGAAVAVIGLFMIGAGNDWTFNRFKRRCHQIDQRAEGVYHEFTGISTVAEQLHRLGYSTDIIFSNGFIARCRETGGEVLSQVGDEIAFPYLNSLNTFFNGEKPRTYMLPSTPVDKNA